MQGQVGLQLVLAVGTGLGFPGLGVQRHCTKPGVIPSIPPAAYQHLAFSRSALAVSLIEVPITLEQRAAFQLGKLPQDAKGEPVPLPVPVPAVLRERLRLYQLSVPDLTIDHCSIKQVAVILHEDGYWTMSLRADQNPWFTGSPQNDVGRDVPPEGQVSNGLLRNQFFVRVRCYTAFPVQEEPTQVVVGKPALIELLPEPFWVQRGRPYDFWTKRCHPAIGKYFDLIDRVELEFFYR